MNIAPNPSTSVLAGYRPSHLYVLIEGAGCDGPRRVGWVLTEPGVTTGDVERVWKAADRASADILSPVLPQQPRFTTWEGTVGEHREATRVVDELRVKLSAAHREARGEAVRAVWERSGCRRVEFSTEPPTQGLDWDDEADPTPGVPVAVVQERGCMCGHGGTSPAEWNGNGDVCGPIVAVSDAGGVGCPHVVLWDNGFHIDVPATCAAQAAAITECLATVEHHNAQLRWATGVTDADIDAMSVGEYHLYTGLLASSYTAGVRRPVANPVSTHVAQTQAVDAAAAAAGRLGVYLFTTTDGDRT